MSRTVSFRCSEELDEYLEEEAEKRMTTKSTVAQMIVAEYFREQIGESEEGEEGCEAVEEEEESVEEGSKGKNGENGEKSELDGVLEEYSEHWYESSGQKNYAVEPPEGSDDKRRYYKTKREAVKRLKEWYA
jgi:predicted transcriptional regulator